MHYSSTEPFDLSAINMLDHQRATESLYVSSLLSSGVNYKFLVGHAGLSEAVEPELAAPLMSSSVTCWCLEVIYCVQMVQKHSDTETNWSLLRLKMNSSHQSCKMLCTSDTFLPLCVCVCPTSCGSRGVCAHASSPAVGPASWQNDSPLIALFRPAKLKSL